MLDHGSFIASPEIQDLITILRRRSLEQDDRRLHSRETVVFPVTIQLQYELSRIRGFTKDISKGGVCLISETEFTPEQIATLSIFQTEDVPTKLRARCIWQKPFGDGYYQSGWKFLRRVFQNGK